MSDEDIIKITDEDIEAADKKANIVIDLPPDTADPAAKIGRPGAPKIQWVPPTQDTITTKESVDIILLVDTSGSMGATDYPPNRLSAAKDAAKMFTKRKVTQNYNDRVGVIGFGGSPTAVHSLDSNLDKVAISIDKITMTHTGTYIGTALKAAGQELSRSKNPRRAIVLLSDGADQYDKSKPLEVVRTLKGIRVFTIGLGTIKGGMAKLPHGQQKVFLNEEILKKIANASGGKYYHAPDVPQLQEIYTQLADY